jgi:hypothetical protein
VLISLNLIRQCATSFLQIHGDVKSTVIQSSLRTHFLLQDSVGFKGLHDLNHSLMVDQSSVCMNSDDQQDVDLELKL